MTTPFELAQRFVGEVKELPGGLQHPLIQWWLTLCGFDSMVADEVPWCSAFVNGMFWLCRMSRTKSAMARSWLGWGIAIEKNKAQVGDVVVLKRGTSATAGHVGFFVSYTESTTSVRLLAGNQGDTVSIAEFPVADILGIRRAV